MTEPVDQIVERARTEGHRAAEQAPTRRAWWRTRQGWTALVGVLVIVAALIVLGRIAVGAKDDAKAATTGVTQLQSALAEANRRIIARGGSPVATPSGVPGAQGPTGATGPGPSEAQINSAVASYCSLHSNCTGTPSRTEVLAAVSAYCRSGVCRGATGQTGQTGATGPSGAPGKDGQAGATGPAPSTSDIANAVAVYCQANGGCTGPAGPKGDTGQQGERGASGSPGVGIESIDCTGLGITITVKYTNGTTGTVTCGLVASTDAPTPGGTP